MSYSDRYFYKKLEINELLDNLKSYALLPATISYFNQMTCYNNKEEIDEELKKVEEAFKITVRYDRAPIYLNSLYDELISMAVKGGILSGKELFETVRLFSSIRANERLLQTLIKERMECKYYQKYVDSLYLNIELEKLLRKSIDDNGDILDDATPELKRLRNRLKGIDERIKHKVQDIMQSSSSMLADTVVVIRDDRYCVAVKAEYKNSFKGILHDLSSSNLTAYMEPIAVAEMSNEKDQLKNLEKEEMERILRFLSDQIAKEDVILLNNYATLIELDKIFAKAKLAISYDGTRPNINTEGLLDLKNARHPLLKVDKVIPNNISFGKDHLGIIITGPNTGGKTVLLKTVGLLSLMIKFGLLIPADEGSNVMVFDHIYCDIGDDQSIKDNLSTFSSHMKKMVAIVNKVTPNSLALFDEIGSGTDPVEGASIAIAVLKYFIKNKVSFITTTHYADLKAFAYSEKKVVNASMAFNEDTMMPTYHLVIGKSGKSNALSIAKNLGLKNEILQNARNAFTKSDDETRRLIENVETYVNELETLEKDYKSKIENALLKEEEYNQKIKDLDKSKDQILDKANLKAKEILDEAAIKAEVLLDEVKQLQNKGVKLHEIIDAKAQIDEAKQTSFVKKKKKTKKNVAYKNGDRVFLPDYQQYGIISRIRKDGSFDVEIGNITVNVLKDEMELYDEPVKEVIHNVVIEASAESRRVSLSLDLRGKRFVDAKDLLEKYIDDLIVSNIKSATIIHGFGTGTIRELVQDFCKKNKYIESYRYGGSGEGGLGVTVITLK